MAVNDYTIRFFKVAKRKTERMMGNARLVHGREKENRESGTRATRRKVERKLFFEPRLQSYSYIFLRYCVFTGTLVTE